MFDPNIDKESPRQTQEPPQNPDGSQLRIRTGPPNDSKRKTKEMIRAVNRATRGLTIVENVLRMDTCRVRKWSPQAHLKVLAPVALADYDSPRSAEITNVEPWAYRPRNADRTEAVWVWSHSGRLKHCGRRG